MDEQFRSVIDNSSEATHSVPSAFNSTNALPTTLSSAARQSVSAQMVAAVGLVIAGTGSIANSVVLAVLVRARRHAGSSVHTLIANQSAMELFACLFGVITLVMMLTHGYRYNGNRIVDGAICVLFEDGASDKTYEKGRSVFYALKRTNTITTVIGFSRNLCDL